ncbi:MAG: serine/threonine protein kinase, partial [Rhodopirellula sp.]|nr:serine/threonine protein kinase [Rhodopirellula sp.]
MTLRNRISLASVWHIIHPEVLCLILIIATAGGVLAERPLISENDWPWWRGHGQDGVAVGDQHPPTQWSPTENVRWRLPIVGRGHGSPTVFADQVFLATADSSKEEQSVVSVDRETGKLNWQTVVHKGGFANKSRNELNKKASLASSSVATDGEKLF